MTTRTARSAAFALAVSLTLTLLAGVDRLSGYEYRQAVAAAAASATTVAHAAPGVAHAA